MKKLKSRSTSAVLKDSVIRLALGKIPGIGDILIEAYQFQSNVKQHRLMEFIQLLYEYSEQRKIDINKLNQSEYIGDLTDSIFRKVTVSNSKEKLTKFRIILINGLTDPDFKFDQAESFLQLVLELNEMGILILNHHRLLDYETAKNTLEIEPIKDRLNQLRAQEFTERESNSKGYANNLSKVQSEVRIAEQDLAKRETIAQKVHKYRDGAFYKISEEEFLFYKQKLFSKGLMIDAGISSPSLTPFSLMSITEYGKAFLKFIAET